MLRPPLSFVTGELPGKVQSTTLILILIAMSVAAFYVGRRRSVAIVGGPRPGSVLHSLPGYYGYFTAIWCLLPALAVILLWVLLEPRIIVALVVGGLPEAYQSLSPGELSGHGGIIPP